MRTIYERDTSVKYKFEYNKYREATVAVDYLKGKKIVEVDSKVLPEATLKKLKAAISEAVCGADRIDDIGDLSKKTVQQFLEKTKLLVALPEIIQIKNIIHEPSRVLVKEKGGKVELDLVEGPNNATFVLNVGMEYPMSKVGVTCCKSNMDSELVRLIMVHANEIARKCSEGLSGKVSSRESDPSKPSEDTISKLDILRMKHDKDYFNESNELQRMAHIKKFRKYKRALDRREIAREIETVAPPVVVLREPQFSIVPIVHLLYNQFFKEITSGRCVYCDECLSPTDVNAPKRTFCGHWYHRDCLKDAMLLPPFGAQCYAEGCTARIYHGDWTTKTEILEKQWAMDMARMRAVQEIDDFLGDV